MSRNQWQQAAASWQRETRSTWRHGAVARNVNRNNNARRAKRNQKTKKKKIVIARIKNDARAARARMVYQVILWWRRYCQPYFNLVAMSDHLVAAAALINIGEQRKAAAAAASSSGNQ